VKPTSIPRQELSVYAAQCGGTFKSRKNGKITEKDDIKGNLKGGKEMAARLTEP